MGINIVNTQELIILMNDGKNFIHQNSHELKKRYETNKKTIFIFLDMNDENIERQMCLYTEKEPEYYKKKANSVLSDIEKKAKEHLDHHFIVYKYKINGGFKNNLIVTDRFCILGIYRNSRGKSDQPPPSIIYEKNADDQSEYMEIKKDIDKVIETSEEFFNSKS